MTSEPQTGASSPQPPRPGRGGLRPDPLALLQGLDRLQDSVRQRLDRLETLAQERSAASSVEPTEREQQLRRRIAELEEKQGWMVAEARRREQEWEAALEQLEQDRQLLAEAWGRLEQEQVSGRPEPAPAPRPAAAVPRPAPPVATAFHPRSDDSNDIVAHAILKQFQTLRGDVRRNGGKRRPDR